MNRLSRGMARARGIIPTGIVLMLAAGLCTGCLAVRSQPRKHHKPPVKKVKPPQPELPGGVTGEGWHMHWRKQTASGRIPVLDADADTGNAVALTRGNRASVAMQQVQAQIYRQGKLAALLTARSMLADQGAERIVATGNVKIHSAPGQSPDLLTADRVTWDVRKEQILAEGHVHYERTPANSPAIITDGNVGTYDLRKGMDEVEIH